MSGPRWHGRLAKATTGRKGPRRKARFCSPLDPRGCEVQDLVALIVGDPRTDNHLHPQLPQAKPNKRLRGFRAKVYLHSIGIQPKVCRGAPGAPTSEPYLVPIFTRNRSTWLLVWKILAVRLGVARCPFEAARMEHAAAGETL